MPVKYKIFTVGRLTLSKNIRQLFPVAQKMDFFLCHSTEESLRPRTRSHYIAFDISTSTASVVDASRISIYIETRADK